MKILIFGITGLIGNALKKYLENYSDLTIYGTTRNLEILKSESPNYIYLNCFDSGLNKNLDNIMKKIEPDFVINSLGLTKHIEHITNDQMNVTNSQFPHLLKDIVNNYNVKILHLSTDCVFSGSHGNYYENSYCDAYDNYGISKSKGEINDNFNLTIRVSTIGHELNTCNGLLEWFLSQKNQCHGYSQAFFTGISTYELASVIYDYIIDKKNLLSGIYHISGEKIDKFNLLKKFSKRFNKNIKIIPDERFIIDRSLNCQKFINKTGYKMKTWDEMLDSNYI